MKKALRILLGVKVSLLVLLIVSLSCLFNTSVLENLHNKFLRFKARNVVKLYNPQKGGGTGSFVSTKSGKVVILTNNHICKLQFDGNLVVDYYDGKQLVKVIKSYPLQDLCIVEAPADVTTKLSIARSVEFGETIYSLGHPLLEPLTVSKGELSANVTISVVDHANGTEEDCKGETYKYSVVDNPLMQLFGMFSICERILPSNSSTMNILPGNSGSPVVNIYGNIVGVVFASVESGVHSYLVPLNDVRKFLEDNK